MVKKNTTRRNIKKNVEKISLLNNFKIVLNKSYVSYKKSFSKFLKYFFKKFENKINEVKSFLLLIVGYGILINIPAHTFLEVDFSFKYIFSFGIMAYFIKEELVELIRRILVKR